jgi:hypothetical protein
MSLVPYSVSGRWRERLHHLLLQWFHHVAQAVAWREGHVGQLSLHPEPCAKALPSLDPQRISRELARR